MLTLTEINNITIETLESYLVKNLWKQDKTFANKKIKLFKKAIDNEEYSLFLPSRNDFKDSRRKINDAIEIIADLRETTSKKIISEILKTSDNKISIINNRHKKDTLSLRIISKLSDEGIIPLEYGANIVEGIKRLILATIFNEENPQPYFFRVSKNSHEKLFRYKLAQTNIGSYIFNIEIDSDTNEQLIINDNGEVEILSEERRVIRRIQNGISNIKENDIEILSENGYKKGLNANMCDALLNFNIDNFDVKIESRVTWSDLIPKPEGIKEKVVLENKDFHKMKELSEKYKQSKSLECEMKGRIIRLNNRKDSKGNSIERNITIQTEIEGTYKNVKIELGDLDYKKACEAHKEDQDIIVSGELFKNGKTWVMTHYHDLRII